MCFNHLRLRLFQLKMNSGITFTPLCVFGFNKNYGQMENQLHVDCKITHFSHKTNAAFILPSNEFQDLERERERAHTRTNQLHSSHTRTNLILALSHAPTSTPHIVRRQAPAAQPSQCQPRSCCTKIAPTQPHRHAPLLHVSDPPPPSPPLPLSKRPSSMSSNPHPSYLSQPKSIEHEFRYMTNFLNLYNLLNTINPK